MLSVALLLWLAVAAQPAVVERATVLPLEGEVSTPLFTFERVVTRAGAETLVDVWFRDPRGTIAVSEKVTYRGAAVVRYESFQHQLDERYVMQVTDDEAVIEVDRAGRISRSTHDWTDDTLTVDQIRPFIRAHWEALMEGEDVSFRLVALDRGRIVRFKLGRRDRTTRDGQPVVVLRMEAASVFVRWLAPEIDLLFAGADDHRFLESRGLLPVKVRRAGVWTDLEGRLVLEH